MFWKKENFLIQNLRLEASSDVYLIIEFLPKIRLLLLIVFLLLIFLYETFKGQFELSLLGFG